MNVARMGAGLPHRAPFLLVDRLLSSGNGEARALRRITTNDPLMGNTLPTPLVIEALAQTAALMNQDVAGEHRGFLVALRNVQVSSQVVAGDDLALHTRRTAALGGLHRVTGEAHVGDRVVLTGELTFAIES
jgi:3-hydroxyacyl-[acyl-carrier-protein] dehydratase